MSKQGLLLQRSLYQHTITQHISLTLKYFEENLMMATSGRNM
jgi:hypothetical protein